MAPFQIVVISYPYLQGYSNRIYRRNSYDELWYFVAELKTLLLHGNEAIINTAQVIVNPDNDSKIVLDQWNCVCHQFPKSVNPNEITFSFSSVIRAAGFKDRNAAVNYLFTHGVPLEEIAGMNDLAFEAKLKDIWLD